MAEYILMHTKVMFKEGIINEIVPTIIFKHEDYEYVQWKMDQERKYTINRLNNDKNEEKNEYNKYNFESKERPYFIEEMKLTVWDENGATFDIANFVKYKGCSKIEKGVHYKTKQIETEREYYIIWTIITLDEK